jgi:putative transposase
MAAIILDELEFRKRTNEIRLFCYCIMPDHLHLLIFLTEFYGKSLQNWVSAFKRHTSKVTNESMYNKRLWQKNFYDHVVRRDESLLKISEYILNNPIRQGMVMEWEEYPYSMIVDALPV